jgi:hypothetical protein
VSHPFAVAGRVAQAPSRPSPVHLFITAACIRGSLLTTRGLLVRYRRAPVRRHRVAMRLLSQVVCADGEHPRAFDTAPGGSSALLSAGGPLTQLLKTLLDLRVPHH